VHSIDRAIANYQKIIDMNGGENCIIYYKCMANLAIINDDLCVLIRNLNNKEKDGYSYGMQVGNLLLKLFEIKLWIDKSFNKNVYILVRDTEIMDRIFAWFKEEKAKANYNSINQFSKIRDKLLGHYDDMACDYLIELGKINLTEFIQIAESFQRLVLSLISILHEIGIYHGGIAAQKGDAPGSAPPDR
jgi:hypothetical protein